MEPKLLVSLSPSGLLQMELPAVNGSRTVVLKDKTALDLLKRTLRDLTYGRDRVGEGGAPTRQQVRHLESHAIFPDYRCPFCRAKMLKDYFAKGGVVKSDQDLMKMELELD